MEGKRDYYEILGVARDCQADELKSAYRRLVLKHHPDRNPGDKAAEERFKECAEAYEVLSDPQKRSIYDRFGHTGLSGQGFQGFRGFEDIFSHFSDLFEDFFGFSYRGRGASGADLRYDLEIEFRAAVFGDEVELEIPRQVTCRACQGTGVASGSSPVPCPTCRGRGQVYRSHGFLRIAVACPECGGQGRIIRDPCLECLGRGRIEEKGRVKVHIPAGVEHGARLRLRGEGEHGLQGGPPGDLYVILHVKPHEFFERDGADLIYTLHLDLVRAALGQEVDIPCLEGTKTLKIPAGVEYGQVFRLRGEGAPRLRGYGRGDLLVRVVVETPQNLTARQKEILTEFAGIEEAKKVKRRGFLGRRREKEQEAEWS